MRWPWRPRRAIESRPMVSRAMELETAKLLPSKKLLSFILHISQR